MDFDYKDFEELVKLKVPCHYCGEAVSIEVEPGDVGLWQRGRRKKVCRNCNGEVEERLIITSAEKNRGVTHSGATLRQIEARGVSNGCKVFKPGDRGFKSRAAVCTPIKQIEQRNIEWQGIFAGRRK